MLTLPASVRIFVAAEPVDLRRGFDGLAAATRSLIQQNPLSGHVFKCPLDCTRSGKRNPPSTDHAPLSPSERQAI